ncbi:RdgB/HAM1 family non-canonical purine NTP pyrophosphatase [Arcobacter sp. FWKO B]|uniref:RdgB/HAM1 family non-canonical purine NTP pyrophosphatase n=1 Tax=Arcobacter sp. FWKO B TaxID=2593672 RepID=UPI0018A380C2|nr:RdgB/HAM1 family non-canonical purine NTP pyrophosphatase [Arcobacter sp. FWKO B]QOG12891.1 RdgB/HAM1 family non-canonical purine NTP pyrophosphatase [Arcobacter sp. FWKO B]
MKIILASNNKGKIKEIGHMFDCEVVPFSAILGDIDIPETGTTFKENAIIKAKYVFDEIVKKDLIKDDFLVISDDSGICIDALDGRPNIYSARFAGTKATDEQNNQKVINELQAKGLNSSLAHYVACICAIYKGEIYTTHGFLYGTVYTDLRGDGGFGYDPLFEPFGMNIRTAQMSLEDKKKISHRGKALGLMQRLMEVVAKVALKSKTGQKSSY